jgi:hypothetical protein
MADAASLADHTNAPSAALRVPREIRMTLLKFSEEFYAFNIAYELKANVN